MGSAASASPVVAESAVFHYVQEHLELQDLTVLNTQSTTAVVDEDAGIVHFKVLPAKSGSYTKYCTGWLTDDQIRSHAHMVRVVQDYTSTKICYQANFALGLDYAPMLEQHAMYIRHLKYCIGKMPGYKGPLWRGMVLSNIELNEMKALKQFYVPSFTSATKNKNKPFPGNAVLALDCSDATWTLEMTQELSPVYFNEEEVLISCYTLFEYVSDAEENGKRIINLKALPQLKLDKGTWSVCSIQCHEHGVSTQPRMSLYSL